MLNFGWAWTSWISRELLLRPLWNILFFEWAWWVSEVTTSLQKRCTPFFSLYFLSSNCLWYSFFFSWKLSKFICMMSFFGLFWSPKYLRSEILKHTIQFRKHKHHIKESKTPSFTFSINLRTKFVWPHGLIYFLGQRIYINITPQI